MFIITLIFQQLATGSQEIGLQPWSEKKIKSTGFLQKAELNMKFIRELLIKKTLHLTYLKNGENDRTRKKVGSQQIIC